MIISFPAMFDRMMEHSISIWLLVSAAYLVFFVGMIYKAIRRWRGSRAPSAHAQARTLPREGVQSEDWVATR